MLILKIAGLIAVGAAAGLVTATGLFALISSIGLINRYADVTDTKEHIMLYEEMIIIGVLEIYGIYLTFHCMQVWQDFLYTGWYQEYL